MVDHHHVKPQRFVIESFGSGRADRWRRLCARIMLGAPLLLGLLAWLPTKRAPLAGEYFVPSALTYPWWSTAFWLGMALTVGAAIAWRSLGQLVGPKAGKPARVLEVTAERFVVYLRSGQRAYARAQIEHLFDDPAHGRLVIRLRGGRALSLASAAGERQAILQALAPDPAHHAAVVPVGSLADTVRGGDKLGAGCFVLALPTALGLLGDIGSKLVAGDPISTALWVTFAVSVALCLTLALALRRRRVVVGSDGIRVDGLLRHRFIPHVEVQEVHTTAAGRVELQRKGRLDVSIATVPPGGGLQERIEAARAIPRGSGDSRVGEALDRGEHSTAQWLQTLGGLLDSRSYRDSAIRIEELEDLLDDPHVAPTRRVAAAVALASDERRRDRVRIAADACADRDLAAALEAAAAGEIAERQLTRADRRFRASRSRNDD